VPVFRSVLFLLYAVALLVLAAFFWEGQSFYLAPLAERAHHPGYWRFKPGGSVSHPLGIAGSGMLVLLLLYSVRKRVRAFRRLGPLPRWLDIHIFLGVTGPLLVVLHSSFKVRGLVALSFWSMVAVALSGVLGRYLYLQIPRSQLGDELTLAELSELDQRLADQLREQFGVDDASLAELERLTAPPGRGGLFGALVGVATSDLVLTRRLRAFARERPSARSLGPLIEVAREKALVHRRLVLWEALHRLFHYWHVVHKPFAVVMYVFMIVHVAVASMTGYAWGAR
jgi:hypothetical protein